MFAERVSFMILGTGMDFLKSEEGKWLRMIMFDFVISTQDWRNEAIGLNSTSLSSHNCHICLLNVERVPDCRAIATGG